MSNFLEAICEVNGLHTQKKSEMILHWNLRWSSLALFYSYWDFGYLSKETDRSDKRKNKDRERGRHKSRQRERERETAMGNEKDRAVIIIAEFAFRMQTDQGHGAWGRYRIAHKHTHKARTYKLTRAPIYTNMHIKNISPQWKCCFIKKKKKTVNIKSFWFLFMFHKESSVKSDSNLQLSILTVFYHKAFCVSVRVSISASTSLLPSFIQGTAWSDLH